MKIVTRAQLMNLPPNTVYSTYTPCWFGELLIKGVTIENNGKNIDWYEQQIADAIECRNSDEYAAKLDDAQKNGTSLRMDFDCEGRDGMFDHSQLYAVWEPQDVMALVARLQQCLPTEPEPKP
jgi:hypothetical protein